MPRTAPPQPTTTHDQGALFANAHLEGKTYTELSQEFGLSSNAIRLIVEKTWSVHIPEIKQLHAEGLAFGQIAKHLRIPARVVNRHLVEAGLLPSKEEQVTAMFMARTPIEKIREQFEFASTTSVNKYIRVAANNRENSAAVGKELAPLAQIRREIKQAKKQARRAARPMPDFASVTYMREALAALVVAPSRTAFKWMLGRSEVSLAVGEPQVILALITGAITYEEAAATMNAHIEAFRGRLFRMGVSVSRFKELGWAMKRVVGSKLSVFDTSKLYARHLLGATTKELEAEFGLSASSVQYILDNAAGVKPLESSGSHKTKLKRAVEFARTCSVEEWNTVLKAVAHADGDTRQAARALGMDEYRVVEVTKSHNWQFDARGNAKLSSRAITKIVRLRAEGKTLHDVAASAGVEAKSVWRYSKKYGIACLERDPVSKAHAAMDEAKELSQATQLELLKCLEKYGTRPTSWSNYPKGFKDGKTRSVLNALLMHHGVERVRNRDAAGNYKKGAMHYKGLSEAIAKLEEMLAK